MNAIWPLGELEKRIRFMFLVVLAGIVTLVMFNVTGEVPTTVLVLQTLLPFILTLANVLDPLAKYIIIRSSLIEELLDVLVSVMPIISLLDTEEPVESIWSRKLTPPPPPLVVITRAESPLSKVMVPLKGAAVERY